MLRHILALAAYSTVTLALWAGEPPRTSTVDVRDTIIQKGAASPIKGFVEAETIEGVVFRTNPKDKSPTTRRWSQVDRVEYAGMEGGAWAKGCETRAHGQYEEAADIFHQLAASGQREWEKVRGSFAEGECLELARKYDQAIAAYAFIVDKFDANPSANPPVVRHKLWIDAFYRMGFCHAMAKNNAEAQKIATRLFEIDKKEALVEARVRGNAVLAMIMLNEGNAQKYREYYGKAVFSAERDTEEWFRFKNTIAELLRTTQNKPKEAVTVLREIQAVLPTLSMAREALVQVSLNLGLALAGADQRDEAIYELLRIDTMPYGSPDQQCEGRAAAAKLMWENAKKITNDPEAMKNQRKVEWAKELEVTARFLAVAAAEGPDKNPATAEAKSLLQIMNPAPAPAPAPAPDPAPKSAAPATTPKSATPVPAPKTVAPIPAPISPAPTRR